MTNSASLSATSVASAAFLGITKQSLTSAFFTLVFESPEAKSSVATFEGRTPTSIPQEGLYPITSLHTDNTESPTAIFLSLSQVISSLIGYIFSQFAYFSSSDSSARTVTPSSLSSRDKVNSGVATSGSSSALSENFSPGKNIMQSV